MTTLPTPGVTPANWGTQLNDYITDRTYKRRNLTGRFYTAPFPSVGTTWAGYTLGDMSLMPFVCHDAGTIDRIGVNCGTAAATAVHRLGIYASDSDGLPDARLVDGGTVDCSTTGAKEVTVSVAVTDGQVIWLASSGQTAIALLGVATGVPNPEYHVGAPSVTNVGYPGFVVTGVTGALPANVTVGPSTAPSIRNWVVYVRFA